MTRQSIVSSVVELQKATPSFELTGIVNNECTFHINGFQIDTDGRWFHSVGGEREYHSQSVVARRVAHSLSLRDVVLDRPPVRRLPRLPREPQRQRLPRLFHRSVRE